MPFDTRIGFRTLEELFIGAKPTYAMEVPMHDEGLQELIMTQVQAVDLAEDICTVAFGETVHEEELKLIAWSATVENNDTISFKDDVGDLIICSNTEGNHDVEIIIDDMKQMEQMIVFLIKQLNHQRSIQNGKEK
jgi:hypothetical protein